MGSAFLWESASRLIPVVKKSSAETRWRYDRQCDKTLAPAGARTNQMRQITQWVHDAAGSKPPSDDEPLSGLLLELHH